LGRGKELEGARGVRTRRRKALDAGETLPMELRDADGPALFRAGQDYRHVDMPLRRG
jgi:hypothetical protein